MNSFPSYEYIKSLSTDEEWHFVLFQVYGDVYVRLSYNEDDNKRIALDVMKGGYLDDMAEHMVPYVKLNRFYEFTKENYETLRRAADDVMANIISQITLTANKERLTSI